MDVLRPLAEEAHKAMQQYDRDEEARYGSLVLETKAKVEAMKITDERLAAYRVDLLEFLELNRITLDAVLSSVPPTADSSADAITPAEIKENGAVLQAIKTYCE